MPGGIDLLLVNPRYETVTSNYINNGLLWVASFVREAGFNVKIYDRNVEKESIREVISKYNPKVIGLSVLTGPVILDAIKVSKTAKNISRDIVVVWGGLHATIFPNYILKEDYIDYAIMNEGEYPTKELLEFLIRKKGKLNKIKNLGYKNKGKIKINEIREFINLNKLPMPAWDLLDMPKYFQRRFYANTVVALNTSRGCPWRCAFCYNQVVNKRKWRGMSAKRIVEMIDFLQNKYGIGGFQIWDDTFDADQKRLIEFCELLMKRKKKIKWECFSRVNYTNEKTLRMQKAAGCCLIDYGVESGSPRMLEFIQKDETIPLIKKAFELCKKAGISTSALFMIGMPTEKIEDINATISLIESLDAYQTIPSIFKLYPGNKLYEYCIMHGKFKPSKTLEEQGILYAQGDAVQNMSEVPTDILIKIYNKYFFRNVINDVKSCLKHNNYWLIWQRIKVRLNIRDIKKYTKQTIAYIQLKILPRYI